MSQRARNLHRLMGGSLRLRKEPATGKCHHCRRRGLERPASHWLFNWADERFPLCDAHGRRGQEVGYEVVDPARLERPRNRSKSGLRGVAEDAVCASRL